MKTPASSTIDLSSQAARQQWMTVLATASLTSLEAALEPYKPLPNYHYLRSPEIGLTMVRGRTGGSGASFNLGEITLTRCVVRLDGELNQAGEPVCGFGYVAGRSQQQAELAAVCDALLQTSTWQLMMYDHVIVPLTAEVQQQRDQENRQTASTQVNFFTMSRGEVS